MSDMLTEPANEYKTVELPAPKKLKTKDGSIFSQDFSRKHFFNYLMHSTPPRAEMIYETPPREQVNKMDELD